MNIYKNLSEEELNQHDRLIVPIVSIIKLGIDRWYDTYLFG